jgi:myo-inositol-1(or 4)-monophosphatase
LNDDAIRNARALFMPPREAQRMSNTERARVARAAASAGATLAHERFRTALAVETKDGKTDVVTDADREAQRRVAAIIRESFPDDPIVGEELDARETVPVDGPAWVVDPIDGTNNFVRGCPYWATSVAAVVDGAAVAAANVLPALGDSYVVDGETVARDGDMVAVSERTDPETFTVAPTMWWDYDRRAEYATATREIVERFGDLRRFGCAQATLAAVADGTIEGTITNVVVNPWDSVAGAAMVDAAGGTVTDLDGDRWRPGARGLVASNGTRHDSLLAAARAVDARREAATADESDTRDR